MNCGLAYLVERERGQDCQKYADVIVTRGYSTNKAREVTRQFLYLRGEREFFVVFDRVEATRREFRRHFFLHVPTQPEIQGTQLTWLISNGWENCLGLFGVWRKGEADTHRLLISACQEQIPRQRDRVPAFAMEQFKPVEFA